MKKGVGLLEKLYKSTHAKMLRFPSLDAFEWGLKKVRDQSLDPNQPRLEPMGVSDVDNANFNMWVYPIPKLVQRVFHLTQLEKTLFGYGYLGGGFKLRDALADLARLRSGKADPGFISHWNVFVGNSASGILDKLIKTIFLLSGGKNEIIFHYPVYPIFNFLILKHEGKPVPIKTTYGNKFLPTPEEIERKITSRTAAICLVYPCNPTGATYLDKRPLERIFSFARKKGIVLIADEIYQDTMHAGRKHISALSLVDSLDGMVSVTSLSKDRPGFSDLRLGYAIGDHRITWTMNLMASAQEWHTPTFLQDLLMVDTCMRIARRGGKYRHHLSSIGLTVKEKEVREYRSCIDGLMEKMQRHTMVLYRILAASPWIEKIVTPEAGNLLFFKVRFRFLKRFQRCQATGGIVLGEGSFFQVSPDEGKGWFRISVSHPLDFMLRAVYSLLGFSPEKRNRLLADEIEKELFYDSRDHRLIVGYAIALTNLNRYKQAAKALAKVSPRGDILIRYQLCYLKGTLALKQGRHRQGIELFEKAARMPVERPTLLPEGRSISSNYHSVLLNIFSKSRLYHNLGVVYSRLKKQKEADRCFRKAQVLRGQGTF